MRTSAVIFITGVKRALGSTSGLIYYTREGYFNITMIDLMDICFLGIEIPYSRPTQFNLLSRLSSSEDNFMGINKISVYVWEKK